MPHRYKSAARPPEAPISAKSLKEVEPFKYRKIYMGMPKIIVNPKVIGMAYNIKTVISDKYDCGIGINIWAIRATRISVGITPRGATKLAAIIFRINLQFTLFKANSRSSC